MSSVASCRRKLYQLSLLGQLEPDSRASWDNNRTKRWDYMWYKPIMYILTNYTEVNSLWTLTSSSWDFVTVTSYIIEAIWAYCNLTHILTSIRQSQWREDDSVIFRWCHSAILLSTKATINNDTKMPKEIILNIYIGIIVLCICCYYNRYIHTTHRHYHTVYQSTNPKSTGIVPCMRLIQYRSEL